MNRRRNWRDCGTVAILSKPAVLVGRGGVINDGIMEQEVRREAITRASMQPDLVCPNGI